jgi:predicted dehydrogenase
MTPVRLLVVGAGQRGTHYARRAVTSGAGRVVAVAEPDPVRRERFAAEFDVPPSGVLAGWEEIHSRLADGAIVATQDRDHEGPAVLLAGLGYDLLLEKPIAPAEDAAVRIASAASAAGVLLAVCHVLRYTSFTDRLRAVIASGQLGEIVSVQHLEPVGWWHHAHSFVRGAWRDSLASSPMLLAKSCHDIDWLLYLTGDTVRRVSSFGGLAHFRPSAKPAGAADRCLDCAVEPGCPYSATRLYLNSGPGWPLSAVTPSTDPDEIRAALRTGPYGECVYNGHNDVVDHQVVTMELTGGATIAFTMTAFAPMEQRKTRIFGTHGFLDTDGATLRVVDFRTGADTTTRLAATRAADHGDGDAALVDAFLGAVATGDRTAIRSDATTSLDGHRVVWAAERARHTGTVVTLDGA